MAAGGAEAAPPNLLEQARASFAVKGPICDSEGFYQHEGECWNDAFQMIILFTDGLKEFTQKFFLEDIIPKEKLAELHPYRSAGSVEMVYNYLTVTQQRFARHYVGEVLRRNTCPVNAPQMNLFAIGKRGNLRAKGVHGKTAAAAGLGLTYDQYARAAHGGNYMNIANLIKMIEPIFFPGHLKVMRYFLVEDTNKLIGRDIQSDNISIREPYIPGEELALGINTADHALCAYTCGGIEYFYDNNYGPVKFPWKTLMRSLVPEAGETVNIYVVGSLRLKNSRTQSLFFTEYYPVLCKKRGEELRYFTFLYPNRDLVEIQIDTPLLLTVGEYEYKIHLKRLPLMTENRKVTSLHSYNLEGIELPASAANNIRFGSRMHTVDDAVVLKQAIDEMDMEMVERYANPETIRAIGSILGGKLISLPASPEADKVYTKFYEYLSDNEKSTAYWNAIEKNYPLLLTKIFELEPGKKGFATRRKNPFMQAMRRGSVDIIPILCSPSINSDTNTLIQEELASDPEGYADITELINNSCKVVNAGGGRRVRRTKRAKRRNSRRRKTIRK